MKRIRSLLALICILALVLTGCAAPQAGNGETTETAETATALPTATESENPRQVGQETETPITAEASQTPEVSASPDMEEATQGTQAPAQEPDATQTQQTEAPRATAKPKQTTGPEKTAAPVKTTQPTAAPKPSKAPAKPTAKPTPKPVADNKVRCTLAIDCRTAVEAGHELASQVSNGGTILGTVSLTLEKGATVYDALQSAAKANGIPVYKVGAGKRIYIAAINSLGERDCGSGSGWMYSVNGAYPNVSCGAYVLQDGDTIQWRYTCNLGKDLGAPVQ